MPLLANPIRLSDTPVQYRRRPPALGEHTHDVEGLVAENFALQAILLRLAAATAERPDLRPWAGRVCPGSRVTRWAA